MAFNTMEELIAICRKENKEIYQVMLESEMAESEMSEEEVYERMRRSLEVMENSVKRGRKGVYSHSGLSGGDAPKIIKRLEEGKSLCGSLFLEVIANAVAVNEVNAAMGIICATPTAGSSGVLPGILMGCRESLGLSEKDQLNFLLTAGACGMIIGNEAGISGAEGGCQAEVGSASAMAAAALTWAAGGDLDMIANALAIALKNILGLVCDPVAGLVEIPCIKRNAMGAANCLAAAELALAGVKSKIPCDEVIEAMGRIGAVMPAALKETALGGLAATKSAKKMCEAISFKRVPKKEVDADGNVVGIIDDGLKI